MQYAYQTPGPQGTLRVARPELTWPIRPTESAQLVGAELRLNDERLPVRYENGVLRAQPSAPLPPGTYRVRCRVSFTPKQEDATITWSFTVAPGAVATLPGPSVWARDALLATNRLRARLGLAPLQLDPRLCAAAQGHAAYLATHQLVGHTESPSKPGFIGETPPARAQTFGYVATLAEDVGLADGTPERIVRALFDAPYHRLPFLRPGTLLFGAGNVGKASGLLFGGDGTAGTTLSPYDGETEVPLTWRNDEIPSPTRSLPSAPKVLGYPIVLAHFIPGKSPLLQVRSARLTAPDGSEVRCLLNTPSRDSELTNACMLIPLAPLKPSTTYNVEITTTEFTRRGRFTTRADSTTSDFGPLDLRPGDLKLTGKVERTDKKNDLLVLRVTHAQAYGTAEQPLAKPMAVTLKLSAQTRFVSQTGQSGTVNLAPGLPLSAIAVNGPLERPIAARTLILLR